MHVKTIFTKFDSTIHDFNNSQQYPDSNGSYVNRMMLNGSAYNSPNLASNRRETPIHERVSGDGSLTNPDVIPSESFSSINDNNSAMRLREQENVQNIESKTNPGNFKIKISSVQIFQYNYSTNYG